jgi:hypothetical protein
MQTVQQDLAHLPLVPSLSSTELSSGTGENIFGR